MTATAEKEIKELIEKAVKAYEVPETCIFNVLTYIEGVKAGAKLTDGRKETS